MPWLQNYDPGSMTWSSVVCTMRSRMFAMPRGCEKCGVAYSDAGWHKTAPVARLTGHHSFAIHLGDDEVGDPQCPPNPGPGGLTITRDGSAAVAGRLGDGTAFTTATFLGSQGEWMIYAALYNAHGYVTSESVIDAIPPHATSGYMEWYRPPSA